MAKKAKRITAAALHRRYKAKLSKPKYGILIAKDIIVRMRDGVRLAADVYFPAIDGKAQEGPWPTVMQRTPYNKSDIHYGGHAEYFCKRGYVAIVMDCRGARHAPSCATSFPKSSRLSLSSALCKQHG